MAEARIDDLGAGASRPLGSSNRPEPPVRGEFEVTVNDAGHIGDVARPLSTWEKIQNVTALRRAAILIAIAVIWQVYASLLDNPLMLPTFWAQIGMPRKGNMKPERRIDGRKKKNAICTACNWLRARVEKVRPTPRFAAMKKRETPSRRKMFPIIGTLKRK